MDAVIAVDARQRIVLFNPAAEQMFGCLAREACGQSIDRFIPGRFREAHRRHIENFGNTGATNRRMGALGMLSGIRADGEEFPIEASISHMEVGGQKLFTVILRDITERKQAQDELQRLNEELEIRVVRRTTELAAAHQQLQGEVEERKRLEAEVAGIVEREQQRLGRELHEGLGQQLAGIGYQMTALQTRLGRVATRSREAERLQGLIRQCVEQTRHLAKEFYPVELERNGLLMALRELASETGPSSSISYVVQGDGNPACEDLKGPVAIQLFRIAQEAVRNSVQHARARQILIRLATADGCILLTVKDDGIGLPPDGNETNGMGLRIMQYRAHMIDGKLDYRNDPAGGVTVTCSVPGMFALPLPATPRALPGVRYAPPSTRVARKRSPPNSAA
jgi:two-component system sensor kinase